MSHDAFAPVNPTPRDPPEPKNGIAFCLSGGGYRAMLFHAGAMWRMYELGVLRNVMRVCSVSGGSIAAGMLAMHWTELDSSDGCDFERVIVVPLRKLASTTIDILAVASRLIIMSPGKRIAAAYRKYLFLDIALADLPPSPEFVFLATSLQTGISWRFAKTYMGDYKTGRVFAPSLTVADAVAASSAFPPFLSPMKLCVRGLWFEHGHNVALNNPGLHDEVVLTDGGVYDNLALEPAYKRFTTLLVSDGGASFTIKSHPAAFWPTQTLRVLNTIDSQVRSLRRGQLVGALRTGERSGAYWNIGTAITDYELSNVLDVPIRTSQRLASIPTRFAALNQTQQEELIDWGYAVCDAALRRYYVKASPPKSSPYHHFLHIELAKLAAESDHAA